MFRAIQTATRPGLHANEDAVGAGERFLFVIDGATGLSGRNYMDAGSDARWFAARTAAFLQEHLPWEEKPLSDILRAALETVRRAWNGPEEAMPTASIAIWRCGAGELELFQLGDCTASLEMADGSVRVWQEQALSQLDRLALEQMMAHCRTTGCTMEQARLWATPILQKHRALSNKPGGYWTLDPAGAGIAHARTAQLPLAACRSVCAYSDGFAQLSEFVPEWDAGTLHKLLMERGAESLMDTLFKMQEQDRQMLRVPRFKLRDDTTAAAARLEGEEEG